MFPKDRSEIQKRIDKLFWAPYSSQTITLSNICRQLAFAEGGICFFFIKPAGYQPMISQDIGFTLNF
jgi:hypothetical protein